MVFFVLFIRVCMKKCLRYCWRFLRNYECRRRKDKKVFFCTYESSYGDSQYLLRKIYIENDEAFWIVNKEKGPQDENTNFSDAKEIVLKDVDFANAIKLFKEDFEGSMKRFKVSKTEE